MRQRLEVKPTPTLYCLLGDLSGDDDCYGIAWNMSGKRFLRALRALAVRAFNMKEWTRAIELFDEALKVTDP